VSGLDAASSAGGRAGSGGAGEGADGGPGGAGPSGGAGGGAATGGSASGGRSGGAGGAADGGAGPADSGPADSGGDAEGGSGGSGTGGAPPDAAPEASPPLGCDARYGAAREYVLCAEGPTRCTFGVRAENTSCTTVCQAFGGGCLGAVNNLDDTQRCTPAAMPDTCDQTRMITICTCSRP
jgi:hypothetical protein